MGFAAVGFSCSAFFSRKSQFSLRGSCDSVYYFKQHFIFPKVYRFANPDTFNAFGGKWYEISHVSEKMIKCFFCLFGKGELNLKGEDAKLFRIKDGTSFFVVILDTRYGIPDLDTKKKIWGDKNVELIETTILDKYIPGRDLVSVYYWTKNNKGSNGC